MYTNDSANRRVVQIEPKQDGRGHQSAKLLDFYDQELIVLLGDPGAGKTHCFRKMAAVEQAPIYSVQRFIARNGDDQAKTVYLDGLDEYRPRTSSRDSNPAITLLQILRKCGQPRLRLSCRFADWLGNTDLELFKDYCGTEACAVLALEPLDSQEALSILADRGVADPEVLLAEATSRDMAWMVSNPQNLLMLADVVTHSGWPTTKRDLFEQWSLRHLTEQKEELRNSQLGHYAAAELIDPAGAACSALLISDVAGIRLSFLDDQLPSYDSVPCANRDTILAALGRTAFTSIEPDVITYAHRTIAEYLGARWLGKRVVQGLPLSRIQALLGVDSYPSPSLRGLHAWLPTFVPLQAATLISKDPVGILIYGDVASLSPSDKNDLVRSLAAVAAENAWFMSESTSTYGLAGLSCADTAQQLIAILRSAVDPAPLKTLVLRAISVGEPLACYRPQLEFILTDVSASSTDRHLAFTSLLRYGPDGIAVVVRAYSSSVARERESIALRSTIISGLYGQPFGYLDIVTVLNDAARTSDSRAVGELWPLTQGIPVRDFLKVLEVYERQTRLSKATAYDPPNVEVSLYIERIIGRVYKDVPENDAESVDRLLDVQIRMWDRNLIPYGSVHFGEILSKRPLLPKMLLESGVRNMHNFAHPPSIAHTLNRVTNGAVTIEAVAKRLCVDLKGRADLFPFSPDLLQKYEALGRCFNSGLELTEEFEAFMELGSCHPECNPLLEIFTRCELDQRRLESSPYDVGVAKYRMQLHQLVASHDSALRRGENPGLQGELAKLYYGLYSGEGRLVTGKQLTLAMGSSSIVAVEQGFIAMVEMQPPPDVSAIAQVSADNNLYYHWYAFLAGLDLIWDRTHDVSALSKCTLAAAFALSLVLDTFDANGSLFPGNSRSWSKHILQNQPEIAEEVFTILLAENLGRYRNAGSLLHKLPDQEAAPWRCKVALKLLVDHQMIETSDLEMLCLLAAETNEGRQQLATIAQQRILDPSSKRTTVDLFWIVVGFALVGGPFETKLKEVSLSHPDVLLDR